MDHHLQESAGFVLAKGTALHRQLFLVLRDQIFRGMYVAGSSLPKEEALCERFGVSRVTVRRALADLAALGLVDRRHGLGTFVREDLMLARPMPSLSVIEALEQSVRDTTVQVLSVRKEPAPRDVASLLTIDEGVIAVRAVRLRSVKGIPVMLTHAWVPQAFGRKVSAAALRKRALYEVLIDQGVVFGRVVQEFTAMVADREEARLLRTEIGTPLIKLVRVMHDADSSPVLHLTAMMSSERSRILMVIPGGEVNTLSAGQIVHDVT